MLWITTRGGGANRFNPYTETFTRFLPLPDNLLPSPVQLSPGEPLGPPPQPAGPTHIANASLGTTFEDSAGNIWFGGTPPDNLSVYNPATETFRHYDSRPGNPFGFNAAGVSDFVEDSNGLIWMAGQNNLVKYSPATDTLNSFLAPPDETNLSSLLLDKNGTLWVGGNRGLYKFNPQAETFSRYQPGNIAVADILQTEDDSLIIATDHDGIFIFNLQSETFSNQFTADDTDPTSLNSNESSTLFQDRGGVIWIGTSDNGLNLLDPRQSQFAHYQHQETNPNSLSDENVNAVSGNNDGLLWLGINSTLNQINQHTGELRFITPEFPQEQAPVIHKLYYDQAGMLWLGMSNRTLLQYNPQTGQFSSFPLPEATPLAPPQTEGDNLPARGPSPPMSVVDITEDSAGNLWVAVHRDGIFQIDPTREHIKGFQPNQRGGNFADIPDNISSNDVRSVYVGRDGYIWIGHQAAGISRYDPATETFEHHFLEPNPGWVEAIYQDEAGILWLATRQGLVRFDPATEEATTFSKAHGLANAFLSGIMADENGNLWLSSQQGLSQFNPQSLAVKNYGFSDGLQGNEFNERAFWQDAAGQMYFGGTNGLTIFNPLAITDNPYKPPVVLTEFSLFNEPVEPGPDSLLSDPIWKTDEIVLDHNQNIFSFEFSALNYAAPQNNHYQYQLEPFDDGWIKVDSKNRRANYTNLDPGDYVFRVQATNNNNILSDKEVTLKLTVLPPWWETTLFRLSLFVMAAVLLAGGFNWRTRSIKRRNLALEKLVNERTTELATAKQDAETANRAKSTFLANMSHELRSPLNAILGFAQVMQRSTTLNPTDRENITIIARSGEHLLNLINQVLDLSKIEAGRTTLNPNNFDLSAMLADIENMFILKAQEKNLQLLFDQKPNTPRYIRTDEIKLRQVIINLLNNALKFTEQGGVSLRVGAINKTNTPSNSSALTLQFEIEDTGVGIAPQDMEYLFTAFVQTESGRQAEEGTGLGLPISRQFIQLMGGDISVQSEPEHGTVFSFTIQAETATPDQIEAPKAEVSNKVIALEPDQPEYRILIVDDKETNRQLLLKLLAPLGFELREAENGQQAIEVWESFEPHLILMDMRMPVMDGYAATKEIKAHTKGQSTAIIALTASSFEEERAIVLSAGCDDFMRKPFREAEIFEKMHQHIGVKFVYDKEPPPTADESSHEILTASQLAVLPIEILDDLEQAITILDLNLIEERIKEISSLQPQLASQVEYLNDNFKFDELLTLIQEAKTYHESK